MIGKRQRGASSLTLVVPDVPEKMKPGIREIIDLETRPEHRGKFYASQLMDDVCSEADNTGMVLMLTAHPYNDGLNAKDLIEWYERMGFKKLQESPVIMARGPNQHG